MTLEELQPEWERIIDTGFSNYKKLTNAERVWFNVAPLITDGIANHYINYGAENNIDTIADLETLNFIKAADLLLKMNALFPNGKPSPDIDERAEQMENWDEKHDDVLENIDTEFWKMSDALEKRLALYINQNNIGK